LEGVPRPPPPPRHSKRIPLPSKRHSSSLEARGGISPRRQRSPGGRKRLPTAAPKATPQTPPKTCPVSALEKIATVVPSEAMEEPRRNPKRKASEATERIADHDPWDVLLEEAHKPLTEEDLEEWEGWIELESDPAFFSTILHELGVRNVKAQEMFTTSEESVATLPKPIFGMIFLFRYGSVSNETQHGDAAGDDVWFANQTTSNACATVALLNTVMNSPEMDIGNKLREFKEKTKELSTPLRGYQLSSSPFIRKIHNSFSRRMDQLNEDLFLENMSSNGIGAKRSRNSRAQKKGRRRKGSGQDPPFHFVAYVPVNGQVWELDGLKKKPSVIGPIKSKDWTEVARNHIQTVMTERQDDQFAFNLLALCQNPLASHACKISQHLKILQTLRESIQSEPELSGNVSTTDSNALLDKVADEGLLEFELTTADVENVEITETYKRDMEEALGNAESVQKLHDSLVVMTKASMGEYRAELSSAAEEELRVKERKNDYGAVLQKWVSKLAEKGVLEDMIADSR
ncbi:ubiquitin carboxyl-terminal hydrolase L5, partial [Geosmithia morbida]